MALNPAHIDIAVRSIVSGIGTLQEASKKSNDDTMKQLMLGLMLLSDGLRIALEIMPHRIERLPQKIDRIEKKIGSV
jgi:hypothetical protein